METAQSNAVTPADDSDTSPPPRVVALWATLKHWGDADASRFGRLAVLVGDAVREGDDASLVAAQRGLRRVFSQGLSMSDSAEHAEERGRLLSLLDLVDWALQRLTPAAPLERLRRGAPDRRVLELLAEEGQLSRQEIADLLSMDESEVHEIGRQLTAAGAIRVRAVDDDEIWDVTPRGRDALLIRLNVQLDSRGVRRVAQDLLEPTRYDKAHRRQRNATAAIVAALLSADRALSFDDLADLTDQRPSLLRLGLNALLDRGVLNSTTNRGMESFLVPDGRFCAVGVEITPGLVSGVVVGLRGNRLRARSLPLPDMRPETVADAIAELVSRLRQPEASEATLPSHLLGIGIELGGHIDGGSGEVVLSPNICVDGSPWRNVPLRELVRERVDVASVIVENDANALAIHQQLFGSLGDERVDFAVLTIGDGVGAGIIAGGELVHGASGMAGELGHLIIHPGGRRCGCGKDGCLEAYAAVPRIIAASLPPRVQDLSPSLEEAAARADVGDERSRRAFREAGDAIGRGVAALTNIVGPREVLIAVPEALAAATTGERESARAARLFEDALRRRSVDHAFPSAASSIKIRHVAELAQYGAQGAAAVLLRRFVEIPLHAVAVDTTPLSPGGNREGNLQEPRGAERNDDVSAAVVGPKTELLEGVNEALAGVMA